MSNALNNHWVNLIEDLIEMRIPFEIQTTLKTIEMDFLKRIVCLKLI